MRVLLATDGSAASEMAIDLAAGVSWPDGSAIRVVSVVEPVAALPAAAWAPVLAEDTEEQVEQQMASARQVVERAARRLAQSGAEIEHDAMRGRAASCIVEDAREFGADLILIGSRGHGTIASMLLGSVSAEVSDHAPCPVLVARTPWLTRAVLGVDGSSYARLAEDWLARCPILKGIAVEATSVADLEMSWVSDLAASSAYAHGDPFADTRREIVAEHERIAADATHRLCEAGLHATARVVEGDAATELLRVARDDQADIICVGTHGRTGLTRLLQGSVARNVMLHAPCSVLIIREAAAA